LLFLGLLLGAAQALVAYALVSRFATPAVAVVLAIIWATVPHALVTLDPTAWSLAVLAGSAALLAGTANVGTLFRLAAGLLAGVAFLARFEVGAYAIIALTVATRDWRPLVAFGVFAGVATSVIVATTPIGAL